MSTAQTPLVILLLEKTGPGGPKNQIDQLVCIRYIPWKPSHRCNLLYQHSAYELRLAERGRNWGTIRTTPYTTR